MPGVIGAGGAPRLPDFRAGAIQDLFVRGVFPEDQILDDAEEALPLLLLGTFGGEEVGMAGGIVNQLREENRAGGGKRATRPPEMQRGGVAVADRLFAGAGDVDRLERVGDLDQFLTGYDGVRGQSN